jgi:hypothetical protein
MEDICLVTVIDKRQFILMPDGTKIPKQIKTIVIDDFDTVDGIVKVHLTLLAKLIDK